MTARAGSRTGRRQRRRTCSGLSLATARRPAGRHHAPLPGPAPTLLAPRSVDVADIRCASSRLGGRRHRASPSSPHRTGPSSRTTRCGSPLSPDRRAAAVARTPSGNDCGRSRSSSNGSSSGTRRYAGRNPLLHGDIPPRTDPLPSSSTDHTPARLLATARTHPLPRYRLVVQVLARTGLQPAYLRPRRRRRHPDRRAATGFASRSEAPQRPHIPLHPDLVELFAESTRPTPTHHSPTPRPR